MKIFTTIAILASVVFAQDLSGIPGCALPCALRAGRDNGCGPGDVDCFCKSAKALADAQACVENECSPAEADQAATGAITLCRSMGVDIEPRHDTPVVQAKQSSAPAVASTTAAASKPAEKAATSYATSCSTSKVLISTASAPPAVYTGAANSVQAGAKVLAAAVAVAAVM